MVLSLPYALAIHTTTSSLGLCLCHPKLGVTAQTWDLGRDMSTQLHDILFQFIHPYDFNVLDYIAVATGPGGFTSTRIGVVIARTLAQQLDVPLFGISSLAAFAWHCAIASNLSLVARGPNIPVLAIEMPTRRGQLFAAIYCLDHCSRGFTRLKTDPVPITQPSPDLESRSFRLIPYQVEQVVALDVWQQQLDDLPYSIKTVAVEGALGYTVTDVLDLAHADYDLGIRSHWSKVHPFYGQSPV